MAVFCPQCGEANAEADALCKSCSATLPTAAALQLAAGSSLVTGYKDGRVVEWDLMERRPRLILTGAGQEINSVACSPDGKMVAATSHDERIRLWELSD